MFFLTSCNLLFYFLTYSAGGSHVTLPHKSCPKGLANVDVQPAPQGSKAWRGRKKVLTVVKIIELPLLHKNNHGDRVWLPYRNVLTGSRGSNWFNHCNKSAQSGQGFHQTIYCPPQRNYFTYRVLYFLYKLYCPPSLGMPRKYVVFQTPIKIHILKPHPLSPAMCSWKSIFFCSPCWNDQGCSRYCAVFFRNLWKYPPRGYY